MIVAHRGASRDAPENTLAAFRLAWRQGADAIEGDFRLTADGQVVCLHDADTLRVAGTKRVVCESTRAALRELDVSAARGGAHAVCRIPTLAEVLSTVPVGKRVYVEIKCGAEILPALLDGIGRSGLGQEQVVAISFRGEVLRVLRAAAPGYKTLLLRDIRRDPSGRAAPSPGEILAALDEAAADGLSSSAGAVAGDFVRAVVSKGYEWHVWTVDDAATARNMLSLGACSITTNRPGPMRRWLEGMAAEEAS